MSGPLKKPLFVKVADIGPAKHCYNVYAKVIEARATERPLRGNTIKVIEGVLGDETATAHFSFLVEQAPWLAVGKTIAVRNGLSSVVDEHILLQVDKFGRLTEERDVAIPSVNEAKNISKTAYEKRAPAPGQSRGGRPADQGAHGGKTL